MIGMVIVSPDQIPVTVGYLLEGISVNMPRCSQTRIVGVSCGIYVSS